MKTLFRGRRLDNGEWVYGSHLQGASDFIAEDVGLVDGHWEVHKLQDETVGQFIGLMDKDKNKAFVGDILGDKESGINFLIEFDRGVFYAVYHGQAIKNRQEAWKVLKLDSVAIIGNIHDNPELLEVTQNE